MYAIWNVVILLMYEKKAWVATIFPSAQNSVTNSYQYVLLLLLLKVSCKILACSYKRTEMHTCLDISSWHILSRIRNAYPAFDLKTNTGKIWSVTTRFPEHILGESKFKISVWTDSSPYPLLLTQHGKWLGCSYPCRIQFHGDDNKMHLLSGKIFGRQAFCESWMHTLSDIFSIFKVRWKSH